MEYRVINELPGRMRIGLSLPRRPAIDFSPIEATLTAIPGVERVKSNPGTRSILVRYNDSPDVRDTLLKSLGDMPLTFPRKSVTKPDSLRKKRRALLFSGMTLLASPLLPAAVRPILTLYGAVPIFKKALGALFRKRLNVDVLDFAGVGVAFGMKDYKAAGTILFLLKVGDYMEERTRQRSRESLARMFSLFDEWAWVRRDGKEARVATADIAEGDLVIVRAGGLIPADGIVVEGEAMVNQSSMTGEPFPVMKKKGVMVYAGTAIEEGRLTVKAMRVGEEMRVSRIIKIRVSLQLSVAAAAFRMRQTRRLKPAATGGHASVKRYDKDKTKKVPCQAI